MSEQIQTIVAASVVKAPSTVRWSAALRRALRNAWMSLFGTRLSDRNTPSSSEDNPFVNRGEQITIFRQAVRDISESRAQVLTFHGASGQGKSYLCKHLRATLENVPNSMGPNLRWGLVDLRLQPERHSEYILLWVRNALNHYSKVSFPSFDFAFALFWKDAHPGVPRPTIENPFWEQLKAHSGPIAETIPTYMLPAGANPLLSASIPLISSILGRLGEVVLANLFDQLRLSEALVRDLFQDGKQRPAREIEQRLPRILARDLAAWRESHPDDRFLILIDEYETLFDGGGAGSTLQQSSSDETVRRLVEESEAALFVFFSREKLRWRGIPETHQHPLDGLSTFHAKELLRKSNVREKAIRAAMVKGASAPDPISNKPTCYPIMLDMQVEHYRSLVKASQPVAPRDFRVDGDTFAAKRDELLGRLVRQYTPQLRSTLLRLAGARFFDNSLFKFVICRFGTGLPLDDWKVFKTLSFLQPGDRDGIFAFHNVIREGLLASLGPDEAATTHEALFTYYRDAMGSANPALMGPQQVAAAAEAFYQRSFDPKAACKWWLETSTAEYRTEPSSRLVEAIDRASADLAEQAYGKNTIEHSEHLQRLAQNLGAQTRYKDAEATYRRVLEVLTLAGADETAMAASALCTLGVCLDYQKRHVEAEAELTRAMEIRKRTLNPEHLEMAQSLTALGTNLSHQNRNEQAETLIREALAIVDPASAMAAIILHNLGLCIGWQNGRLQESEERHKQGLELRLQLFAPDHYLTGQSLGYVAFALIQQGKYDEAAPMLRRARAITEAAFGLEHHETASSIRALARALHKQHLYAEAVKAHGEALAIRERVLGPGDPDTADSCVLLGRSLQKLAGQAPSTEARKSLLDEAISYLQRGYEIRHSHPQLGPNHADTKLSARRLGQAYIDLSRA